jgi:drug/metabolite transporter (DMT)-like permease
VIPQGISPALGAALLVSGKDLTSKYLAGQEQVSPSLSTLASFGFALPYYGVLLLGAYGLGFEDFILKPAFYIYVLTRSLTDLGAEWLKMWALKEGDLSLVSPILSLAPLFLILTSPLLTRDPMDGSLALCLLLTSGSSVLLVMRPGKKGAISDKKPIFLALGSAFCFSLNSALDRLAVQEGSPLMSSFAMTLVSALFMLPVLGKTSFWGLPRPVVGAFWFRGFLEVGFMVCKMTALSFLSAPVVMIFQRFSVIFTTLGGSLIYKEPHGARRLGASFLVLISGIMVLF